jgi:hypothetical protein
LVSEIFPVTDPVGAVVAICVSELTVNVAVFPTNLTDVACGELVPVRITWVPTGPLIGAKLFGTGTI